MKLRLVPIDLETAKRFVHEQHRHLGPSLSWKFGVGAARDDVLVGVVMVGRPVARGHDDGLTLEVTRCCTNGEKNAASMLYGAAWRAAKSMGYTRLVTYTLESEPGTSLMAAGFANDGTTRGGSWDTPSRRRESAAPKEPKVRWVKT